MPQTSKIAAALLVAGLGCFIEPVSGQREAAAGSPEPIVVVYEVAVSGLTALKIRLDTEISGERYASRASIEPEGLASIFSDYRMKMKASGMIEKGHSMPASFSSRATSNSKAKTFEISWDDGDQLRQHQQPDKDLHIQTEVQAALTPGTTDPLSALFRLSEMGAEGPCKTVQRVYSGQNVHDLRFSYRGSVTLDADFGGGYQGPAYECRMIYEPVAGRAAHKARKRKIEPPVFTLWLAPVQSASLPEPVLIPIAAKGTLDGKKFVALAKKATIAGRPLSTMSVEDN